MKKIDKKQPFDKFADFVKANKPQKWDKLSPQLKRATRDYILKEEQNNLDGYTEIPLKVDKSHIDHYCKKGLFQNLTYEWNNLIVASKDNDFGANYKDKNINFENKEIYDILINPVEDNPKDFFEYTKWGDIVSKNDLNEKQQTQAKNTIIIFNLNHESLRIRRENIIRKLLPMYKEEFSLDETKEYLKDTGFVSVIEYFYKK